MTLLKLTTDWDYLGALTELGRLMKMLPAAGDGEGPRISALERAIRNFEEQHAAALTEQNH